MWGGERPLEDQFPRPIHLCNQQGGSGELLESLCLGVSMIEEEIGSQLIFTDAVLGTQQRISSMEATDRKWLYSIIMRKAISEGHEKNEEYH